MIEQGSTTEGFYNSLWFATAPPPPETGLLDGEVQTDVLVIGGGFTGLSSALHLATRGIATTLLESHEIGTGGSGRNGGHVTPTFLHYLPSAISNVLGPEWGPRMVAMQAKSASLVFDLIERHGIACEAIRSGFVQMAHTPARVDRLKHLVDEYSAIGQSCRLLTKSQVDEITGSPRYYAGWQLDDSGNLNPLAYARGLAKAALENGAKIYTRSPVEKISRAGSRWVAETPYGCVKADKIIFATDAYGTNLVPKLDHSFYVMTVYNIATEPLTGAAKNTILPFRHHVGDLRRDPHHFRLDGYGRLVTTAVASGNRGRDRALTWQKMSQRMAWIFPQLGKPKWKWYWHGNISVTTSLLPNLFEVGPNAFAGVGYSGRGIPTGTAIGQALAALAAGADRQDLPMAVKPVKTLLGREIYQMAAPQSLRIARLKDWVELRPLKQPYF
jgi:glycine/D-amino acid oxidase-like deaminating enzyme